MNKSSSFLVHLRLLHFVFLKKISIFKRKILHILKEKSPMNKSSIKISKTSMEKSLRINLQGKISMNKFSKGKISKTIFQRKNIHEQIFIKIFSKISISKMNLQGKISTNKSSKGTISIFQRKNLQNHFPKEKSP